MLITDVKEIGKSRVHVYIDYEYAFLLYKKDMTRYKLKLGFEISQELYDEIIKDTVFRRAKQKALAILKYMDRTEYELRNKLSDSGYNPVIVEKTIDYINSYNYLDDESYTRNYINFKKHNISKRQIE